jgi:hypothetical protein
MRLNVAVLLELPGPVARAAARLHPDRAWRQRRYQFTEPSARHVRPHQFLLARFIDAVYRKDILGEMNADEYDSHGLPLSSELMRVRTSHRGTSLPFAVSRPARDGEVPFIR